MTIDQLPYLAPSLGDSFAHTAGGGSYKALLKDLALLFCPIGKLWISSDPTSPAEIIGGTWEQVKDRFILAAGDVYTAGEIGGEAEHTLSVEELPEHTHHPFAYYNEQSQEWVNLDAYWPVSGAQTAYAYNGASSSAALAIKTGIAGEGAAHNNMPPYKVYYVWERTA